MAVDVGRYAARRRAAELAKERRQKQLLAAGLIVLAGLIAFQGPRTLSRLRASESAAPAPGPAPAVSTPATRDDPARAAAFARREAALRRLSAKDPFFPQISSGGSARQTFPATAPAVRETGLVMKDPFVQQLGASTATTPPTGGGTVPAAAADTKGRYIVVLASLLPATGHRGAATVARQARASGLGLVGVLESSRYATLRSGFWVVYSGVYPTLGQALQALDVARSHGYVDAYTRLLG